MPVTSDKGAKEITVVKTDTIGFIIFVIQSIIMTEIFPIVFRHGRRRLEVPDRFWASSDPPRTAHQDWKFHRVAGYDDFAVSRIFDLKGFDSGCQCSGFLQIFPPIHSGHSKAQSLLSLDSIPRCYHIHSSKQGLLVSCYQQW